MKIEKPRKERARERERERERERKRGGAVPGKVVTRS
jgi:hypothetical protein